MEVGVGVGFEPEVCVGVGVGLGLGVGVGVGVGVGARIITEAPEVSAKTLVFSSIPATWVLSAN